MNKGLLEVIRINEDIIATSVSLCDNSVFFVELKENGEPKKMKYNSTLKNSNAFVTWFSNNENSLLEATDNAANHGKCLHFYDDGSYEECPNIEEHNRNNWQDYENEQ